MAAFRHPVVAVSHGPGPLWLLKDGFDGLNYHSAPAQNLRSIIKKLYPSQENLPKRILFVSAHFESDSEGFEISDKSDPDMIYDYYGFPSEAYEVVYGAKGEPAFAKRVQDRLTHSNIKAKLVDRGFDHGVFVPMLMIRPEADIPIVTLSINDRLGPKEHFELGKALAPFREEDTLIICSGQATHNLRAPRNGTKLLPWADGFQKWLDSALGTESKWTYNERREQLEDWYKKAPYANLAHPTPDHFNPFVVAAGAGMEESRPAAEKILEGWAMGHMSFATYAYGITA